MSKNIKNIVYSGLIIAIGVLLPQVFHVFGQDAGKMFLPMHIPVLLAGFIVGPWYGVAIGLLVPVLSSLFTGMPPVPMVYFMLFELMTYALIAGVLSKKLKWNVYVSLIGAMLCGRLVYGLSLVAAVNLLGLHLPFANWTAFVAGVTQGLPGIAIQLIIIPPILYALKRGGLAIEKRKASATAE